MFPEPSGAPLEFQPIALTAQAVVALHSTRQLNQVGQRVQRIPPLHDKAIMTRCMSTELQIILQLLGKNSTLS